MNFSNEPPVPPVNTCMGDPVINPLGCDLTIPSTAMFLKVSGLLFPISKVPFIVDPVSGVLAIVVFRST